MLFARFRVFPIKILLNYYPFLYIIHIKRELGDRYHETYCTNRRRRNNAENHAP